MLSHEIEVRVRYAETDQMGFVYHGNYLPWFEMARIALLDAIGLPYREMEAEGVLLPVLEARVRYRRPAHFDDRLTIRVELPEKPLARIELAYRVTREGTLLAEGHTAHAWINRQGHSIRPPGKWRAALDSLFPANA
jgi:acyl-CoA thioester hydrolase